MKTLYALTFGLLMGFGNLANAQNTFVQFIVTGLDNEEQCRVIEDSVRAHLGFGSVRVESVSGNFFASINSGYSYSKNDFRQWLIDLGFDLYCYRTGVLGVDQPRRIKRTECELLELKQQE